jgi:hypothetical protein
MVFSMGVERHPCSGIRAESQPRRAISIAAAVGRPRGGGNFVLVVDWYASCGLPNRGTEGVLRYTTLSFAESEGHEETLLLRN